MVTKVAPSTETVTEDNTTITTTVTTEDGGPGYYCVQEVFPSGATSSYGRWDLAADAFAALDDDPTAGPTAQVVHKRYATVTTRTAYATPVTR